MIRESILREEAEQLEFNREVRSKLREQMLQLLWPVLGRPTRGLETKAAMSLGTITTTNSSLPILTLEVCFLLGFYV